MSPQPIRPEQASPSQPEVSGRIDGARAGYQFVPVDELHDMWPMVRDGIEQVRVTNGEPWIPEDVYSQLVNGKAWLHVITHDDTGGLAGFTVTEVMTFPYSYQRRLNIWIGWSNAKAQGWMGIQMCQRIAEALGLHGVVFASPQVGKWTEKYTPITTWYEV